MRVVGLNCLASDSYQIIELTAEGDCGWSNINSTLAIYSRDPATGTGADNPGLWDKTPEITDASADSRTWKLNGTESVFVD
ncbi:MAG: hypothetical protein MN733_16235 [Nitrososphaera sp.]|nr:hypothetical protein [Nitrososphaera sp.]